MNIFVNTNTIFYERVQRVSKIFFSTREDNIHISSYRVMFFLLYGQKSEQVNKEHINAAGKRTRFSCVTYFLISSLVKMWKIRVF